MGNAKSANNPEGANNAEPETSANGKPRIKEPNQKSLKKNSNKGAGSARSSMSSEGRGKPVLPLSQRQIIKYCIDNSKDDLGERIFRRVIEKRDDFRNFADALPKAQRVEMCDALKDFLLKIVDNLTDNEDVRGISEEFGARHVPLRIYGFKPDFFSLTADGMTTECIFLDAAVHQHSETLSAWSQLTSIMFSSVRDGFYAELRRLRRTSKFRSQLTSIMFSSVRDGFYAELRRLRRASNCMNNGKMKNSIDISLDGSTDEQSSRRSVSPAPDTSGDEGEKAKIESLLSTSENNNFLCPPQVY
uniref:Globin family profile domain-containing protein n=1 Tax=Acrobeloides nanus TaxID=290746 RepID=A0A914DMP5_9BILA